ncbi:phage late control D family protein [Rhizobacter sp. J219]|uniref:phage late control D family protein n=1 Tax=Rhizobacter sp. J219 TaxID=2898430 RepID=UPI0021517227|nr:phage late control D family protein [Rhizobacter sp. J219]MCR5885990.1 phage late control D family protein [Rhizobacter sp. J219]
MNPSTMTSAVTAAVSDGLSRLAAMLPLGQHKRLLQLETALPSATLVVERAQWQENVNDCGSTQMLSPLVAEVDALSTSAQLSLKALIGEQMSLRLLCADGRYRTWHGYVAQAAQLGADGGLARYRLQLVAFTHFLGLRHDTRVFLGQRADAILTTVLGAYPQANFRLETSAPTPWPPPPCAPPPPSTARATRPLSAGCSAKKAGAGDSSTATTSAP